MKKQKHIVLGVTGGIAAYKACAIINRLRGRGFAVSVVMTAQAEEFITPLTLQTLSGNTVVRGLFALPGNFTPAHISLAQKADLVLIAPATANIIAKLACGIADDALTALCLSTVAPIVICCAMNEKMYQHKITQENISRLKKIGHKFIGPVKGRLACGDIGMGHLSSSEEIVREASRLLKKSS